MAMLLLLLQQMELSVENIAEKLTKRFDDLNLFCIVFLSICLLQAVCITRHWTCDISHRGCDICGPSEPSSRGMVKMA